MPSDKSRFTIPNRARDDDDAAVVGQRVGYLLWHPPFIRSQRHGRKLAEVGEGVRGVILTRSAVVRAQLWPESEMKADKTSVDAR